MPLHETLYIPLSARERGEPKGPGGASRMIAIPPVSPGRAPVFPAQAGIHGVLANSSHWRPQTCMDSRVRGTDEADVTLQSSWVSTNKSFRVLKVKG